MIQYRGLRVSEANPVLNWNPTCQSLVCVTMGTANLGAFLEGERSEANPKCIYNKTPYSLIAE